MKILLVNDYSTPTAGAERLTISMRDELRARGHDVRVFASRAELIPGEQFADVSCHGTTSRSQTLTSTWNVSAARELQREVDSFRPDVVHVVMFLWQLSPSILTVLQHVPSIYYVVTYKAVCPTGLKWTPAGVECTHRAGMKCLSEGCITASGALPLMLQRGLWRSRRDCFAAIVACSHAVRNHLAADGIQVTEMIWPGIPSASARTFTNTTPTITYAGRLVREKGVHQLIEAFASMSNRAAILRIAGRGPAERELQALAGSLGIADKVRFEGQLDDHGLDELFASSWLHVVPSLWPEPFGITATEAMMRGVPVAACRTGGLAESIVDGVTGYHMPVGDVAYMSAVLDKALASREQVTTLGERSRDRALQHFTRATMMDAFEALYARLTKVQRADTAREQSDQVAVR